MRVDDDDKRPTMPSALRRQVCLNYRSVQRSAVPAHEKNGSSQARRGREDGAAALVRFLVGLKRCKWQRHCHRGHPLTASLAARALIRDANAASACPRHNGPRFRSLGERASERALIDYLWSVVFVDTCSQRGNSTPFQFSCRVTAISAGARSVNSRRYR